MEKFKVGDRVRAVKWGKCTEADSPYIGLAGTVQNVSASSDFIAVKLDNDPIPNAGSCPFFPSELEIITEKEEATN